MTNFRKLLFFVFSLLLSWSSAFSQTSELAVSAFDARDRLDESIFPIIGSCHFFEGQLLSPEECVKVSGEVINFPQLWKDKPDHESGLGFATYAITILLPRNHSKELGLAIPQVYSSYRMWVNGKLIAENGVVAKTKELCKPQWMPQTVAFEAITDSLSLVLQIANFHHDKGGIKEPIYLGPTSKMNSKRTIAVVSNISEATVLFLVGVFFLFIFLTREKKKVTIYFTLLCLTWSLRSVFSNLYLAISFFPDFDWDTMVRIEYITLYLTMIWAILFLSELFQFEANIFFKYSLMFCNLLFTVFTIFSSPRSFTQWLNFYLTASAILLLYGGFTVIRAWVNERVGSGLLTISIILGLNIFAYDIFVYEGFSSYDPFIFSLGYITIFILMGWALSMHLGIIKSKPSPTSSLTYDDLFKNG